MVQAIPMTPSGVVAPIVVDRRARLGVLGSMWLRVLVAVVALTAVGTPALAVGTDACVERKLSAAGKALRRSLVCAGREIRHGVEASNCAGEALDRFARRFQALDETGLCEQTGDAAVVEAEIDAVVDRFVALIKPVCGDGVLAPSEECDGALDDACPGECQLDCGCPEQACVPEGDLCFDLDDLYEAPCCEGLVCPVVAAPHAQAFCRQRECLTSPDCPAGSLCFAGLCGDAYPPYGTCEADADCVAPQDGVCWPGGGPGVCAVPIAPPQSCLTNPECDPGGAQVCYLGAGTPGFCAGPTSVPTVCVQDAECAVPPPPHGGTCYLGAGSPGVCVPCDPAGCPRPD